MVEKNFKFIKTKDEETADILKKYYKLISNNNGEYVFANGKIQNFEFELINEEKIEKTNTLTF